jgi:hypothetical protein
MDSSSAASFCTQFDISSASTSAWRSISSSGIPVGGVLTTGLVSPDGCVVDSSSRRRSALLRNGPSVRSDQDTAHSVPLFASDSRRPERQLGPRRPDTGLKAGAVACLMMSPRIDCASGESRSCLLRMPSMTSMPASGFLTSWAEFLERNYSFVCNASHWFIRSPTSHISAWWRSMIGLAASWSS